MTVSVVTVNATVTTILDGTQTAARLVKFGGPAKICGGSTTGFTLANGFPIDWQTPMVWPAGVRLSAIRDDAAVTAFVTEFG